MKLKNWRIYKEIRQKLRHDMTRSEVILWSRLKGSALGVKFRRQHGIGPYIVDFFCPEKRLVIELDGSTHAAPERIKKDAERLAYLRDLGLTVLVYTDTQVFESVEGVLDDIERTSVLIQTTPDSAKDGVLPSFVKEGREGKEKTAP